MQLRYAMFQGTLSVIGNTEGPCLIFPWPSINVSVWDEPLSLRAELIARKVIMVINTSEVAYKVILKQNVI